MKKLLFALLAGSVSCGAMLLTGCSGCKELGPNVSLSNPSGTTFADSTWMLSASAIAGLTTDAHNVLVEEFSGQGCPNCPAGHSIIEAAQTQYPGRINAIILYPYGPPQAIPPSGSQHDFEDSFGYSISNYVTGAAISGLPSAFIDRVSSGGTIVQIGPNTWTGIITSQLPVIDSVDIAIQSSYNTISMIATITATVIYTQPTTTKQNLSIVVVEDSMYDLQEDVFTTDTAYLFTDVFRGMVSTAPSGDPILDTIAVKVRGRAYRHTYSYKLKTTTPAIVPAHCRVIAFVNNVNGTDYHVLQSAQTKLTGP